MDGILSSSLSSLKNWIHVFVDGTNFPLFTATAFRQTCVADLSFAGTSPNWKRTTKKKENMKHRNCDIHYERFHRRDNIAKYIDLGHASDVSDEQAIEHQGSIFSMHKSDYF